MSTKIVVLGAEGLLGSTLVSLADSMPNFGAVGLDREACDITDLDRIREVCAILRPKVLVNCAAFTDVDGAESHREQAMLVNATGAGNVAKVATSHGAEMVHISTDYVFDGKSKKPYKETAKPGPLSVYGESKLAGEEEVRQNAARHLIVRTGWLYGRGESNFVAKILNQARAGGPLRVVEDQIGSPTSAYDLAEVILKLLRLKKTGTINAVNGGQTSWFGLANAIIDLAGLHAEVQPISSDDLQRPAKRPKYSVLDTSKLETWIDGPMASWEDALQRFITEEAITKASL